MHSGKCPKCEKRLDYLVTQPVELRSRESKKFAGVSHSCPKCKALISVEADPYKLASAIVKKLRANG